jgi:hypothetical protein
MKSLLTGVVALLVIGLAGTANAATNEDAIKSAQAGKGGTVVIPPSELNFLTIALDQTSSYKIDIKAHICYMMSSLYEGVGSQTHVFFMTRFLVPCQNIKKGYPIVAPIITWND